MIDANLDWASFLGRHDLTWSVKPVSWDEGAFIGNGWIGAMAYSEEHRLKRNVLRFVLGRTDVTAKRPAGGYPPRVPIGELHLELAGWLYQPYSMRLDLWNAELRAEIATTAGSVKLRAFVHGREMAMAVELETSGSEESAAFQWYPYPEVDPILKNADGYNLNPYIPESEVIRSLRNGIHIGTETFKPAGSGGCTTAWIERKLAAASAGYDERRVLLLSIQNGSDETAVQKAVEVVKHAGGQPWDEWVKSHRSWWHAYFPQSFVSIPDTMLEGFYWIQMYKLASTTRAEGMIMDNQGPWMTSTPWPGVWFNMNVQMAYSPVYASNRLDIGLSLTKAFSERFDQLILNVPETFRADSAGLGRSCSYDLAANVDDEKGNLLWVCHNIWRQYRHSMDDKLLKELLYPLLQRAVQYHVHLLEEGDDGKLHLPPTISPEYGSFLKLTVPDAHYDLALLRWGCETLLRISERMEQVEADKAERGAGRRMWAEVLERLTPLPTDETGYMIGRGQPLEFGHRHFSHLMAVFPLHLVSGEAEEEKRLILRSLRHWLSREGDLRGFTFTGAASIAAVLGLGDEALTYLKSLVHLLKPNTMYKEAGPVIESPLAGAESIQDMLLQSWGEWIRIFPAVPGEWRDTVFHDLRTEGAFLVSAIRSNGETKWIRVKSLAGEPCRLITDMNGRVGLRAAEGKAVLRELGGGRFELDIARGGEAILYAEAAASGAQLADDLSLQIRPVPAEPRLCGYFGGRKPWRLFGLSLSANAGSLVDEIVK
ncbi:glycosyl hydrolase family 95 catalytic domain-containing protein [Paenibacillus arenilitoris]|uniref:Glycosyl hydrolase family 95 catalytic domain-containing protein n=1 Tax=Paenibacillus arenilitoris TaxID=2772299 RepID=A0A927CML8_9BACL|nr:hypothetical protein [Paenibacillus arenilitoris]MBD2870042.1 hypothetical protein [Paenibacillus arenilitoris]